MSAATLTERGQVVIPAEIRNQYGLTPGTQVEFVDEGGVIRLIIKRKVAPTEPATGYGMIKVPPAQRERRLSRFDPAQLAGKDRLKK